MDKTFLLTESMEGRRHGHNGNKVMKTWNHWSRCSLRSRSISLDLLAIRTSPHTASLWGQWTSAFHASHHLNSGPMALALQNVCSQPVAIFLGFWLYESSLQNLLPHLNLPESDHSLSSTLPFSFTPCPGCPLPTGHHAWRALAVPGIPSCSSGHNCIILVDFNINKAGEEGSVC